MRFLSSLSLMASLRFTLGLLFLLPHGSGRAAAAAATTAGAVWVAESGGVSKIAAADGSVLLTLPDLVNVRAVAVDDVRLVVWLYSESTLYTYSLDGVRLSALPVSLPDTTHIQLVVNTSDGSAWLAARKRALAVSAEGASLASLDLAHPVADLALDSERGLLWVATVNDVSARDATSAAEILSLPLPNQSDVRDLSLDLRTGAVWVALRDEIRRYLSDGSPAGTIAEFGSVRLAGEPGGGVWVASSKELRKFTSSGSQVASLEPFAGQGTIDVVALDPSDGTLWVADGTHIARVNSDGSVVQVWGIDGPNDDVHIWDLAVYADVAPPELAIIAPADGTFLSESRPTLIFRWSDIGLGVDPASLDVESNGTPLALSCAYSDDGAACSPILAFPEGAIQVVATVADRAGNLSLFTSVGFIVDTEPPTIHLSQPPDGQHTDHDQVTFSGLLREPASLTLSGVSVAVGGDFSFSYGPVPLLEGENLFVLSATDRAGNRGELTVHVVRISDAGLPPDPSTVAPPLDPTVPTDIAEASEFLYTGSNPIQADVAPGTIEARRIAVVRGKVLTRAGGPLAGVRVSIHGKPEFGETLSRADGMFDLAVNGGGVVTLQYDKLGYLPAQRQLHSPWRDYAWVNDVVLIPVDVIATSIVGGATVVQVARGSLVQDDDGSRQATILFPAGTTASMRLPDGSTAALSALTVRATEYTVGRNGPASMPGELPPTSSYTYAVELSVDEAVIAGARNIEFSRPVVFYVENFLDFPTGGIVPVGYYDRDRAAWIPATNGRIVAILAEHAGLAEVDVDGNGQAASVEELSVLGIGFEERERLAMLYEPGQSLWRVTMPHFSPWDCNWPYGPPADAEEPPDPDSDQLDDDDTPREDDDDPEENEDCYSEEQGSIIECENQTLGEEIAIAGTPYRLHYRSNRVPGQRVARRLRTRLSSGEIPESVKRIELSIDVAGRRFTSSFSPQPRLSHSFEWDGRDAYGRSVQGGVSALVRVGYVYDAVYMQPAEAERAFAALSTGEILGVRGRREFTVWRSTLKTLGSWNAAAQGLGGWTLTPVHVFDFNSHQLLRGDGSREHHRKSTIERLNTVYGVAEFGFGPDGSLYYTSLSGPCALGGCDYSLFRVRPDGSQEAVLVGTNLRLTVAPDGVVYLVSSFSCGSPFGSSNILKLDAPWQWTRIAQIAGPACLGRPAVAADGTLFVADWNGLRGILRVPPDGRVSTFVDANSDFASAADGNLALSNDGDLYSAHGERVWRLEADGQSTAVAGTGLRGFSGDGGIATLAQLASPSPPVFGRDGRMYFADRGNSRVRTVAVGAIRTIAGNGSRSRTGDGGYATAAAFDGLTQISKAPDGSLVTQEGGTLRRLVSPLPQFGDQMSLVDRLRLVEFDADGRHVRSLDSLTGEVEFTFEYDTTGKLSAIADRSGEVTRVERDTLSRPTAIVSPDGIRTHLELGSSGYLAAITNPANETFRFSYTEDGLLTSMTDPKGGRSRYAYSPGGRLVRTEDALGSVRILRRSIGSGSYEVRVSSESGRQTSYGVANLLDGGRTRTARGPLGLASTVQFGSDDSRTVIQIDGSTRTIRFQPDPRFGMQAALLATREIRMPSGLLSRVTMTRAVVLADARDPLSLRLTDTFSVNGRVYTSLFEHLQSRFTIRSPMGRVSSMTVGTGRKPLSMQVGALSPMSFSYDARDRLSSVAQGSGSEQRSVGFAYAPEGWLASITDPLSRTVSFERDAVGRVTRQTLPDGRFVLFGYDANGNLTSVTPPGRQAHVFRYTPVNLRGEYEPPDLGAATTSYTYNADRQLTAITRPDGKVVVFDRDSAGRLSQLRFSEGSVTYGYATATGKLETIVAPAGLGLHHAYDGFLPTRTTWSGPISGSVGRTYDVNLKVRSRTVNSTQPISQTFDSDGLLIQAGALTIDRDIVNGVVTGTRLGEVTTTHTYNGFGEISTLDASFASTPLLSAAYSRDLAGRIIRRVETIDGVAETYDYTYDPTGRLTDVSKNGTSFSHYDYDTNSNRAVYRGTFGEITGRYDAQDRLVQYGSTTYMYTPNGELQSKSQGGQTVSYRYDELGNLRSVRTADGIEIEYLIDGGNRRVGKKVNGTLVKGFLWESPFRIAAELDGSGSVVSRFIYGMRTNIPEYMVKGGAIYRIIADHLGSPRLVVSSANGIIAQRVDYDDFGRVLLDTNPGFQPFGFAGGLFDAQTGLARFGARDYDAEVGRWTAQDPLLFDAAQLNLYGYVLSDPMNLNDVSGLAHFCKRPLSWSTWINGASQRVGLVDGANLEFSHEQLFFDDGSGDNLGFGPDGLFEDRPNNLPNYRVCENRLYDDAQMRHAVGMIEPGEYDWKWNNCQDWSEKVRRAYEVLQTVDLINSIMK